MKGDTLLGFMSVWCQRSEWWPKSIVIAYAAAQSISQTPWKKPPCCEK